MSNKVELVHSGTGITTLTKAPPGSLVRCENDQIGIVVFHYSLNQNEFIGFKGGSYTNPGTLMEVLPHGKIVKITVGE